MPPLPRLPLRPAAIARHAAATRTATEHGRKLPEGLEEAVPTFDEAQTMASPGGRPAAGSFFALPTLAPPRHAPRVASPPAQQRVARARETAGQGNAPASLPLLQGRAAVVEDTGTGVGLDIPIAAPGFVTTQGELTALANIGTDMRGWTYWQRACVCNRVQLHAQEGATPQAHVLRKCSRFLGYP